MLEEALVATVKEQVLTRNANASPGRRVTSYGDKIDSNNNGDDSNEWLRTVLTRCSESSTGTDNEETPTDTTGSMSSSSSSLNLIGTDFQTPPMAPAPSDSQTSPIDRKCRRKINFDRIQTAIRRLVEEASTDVRSQYGHLLSSGAATQSLLQRRVASELMVRLARSNRDGEDMETSLENAILYEEEWDEVKSIGEHDHDMVNVYGSHRTNSSEVSYE
jgi:hypothetical protein